MNYPEYYYPHKIEKALVAKPSIPSIPVKPTAPFQPIKPSSEYSSDTEDYGFFGCMFVIGILSIIIIFYFKGDFPIGMLLLGIFLIFISGSFIFSTFKDKVSDKRNYPQRMMEYEFKLNQYNDLKKKYEKDMVEYEIELEEYEELKDELLKNSNIVDFRKSLIYETLRESNLPERSKSSNHKKGVSERVFLRELRYHFYEKIHTDMILVDGNNIYYPDFVYWDFKTDLLIDIEIDEPYIGSTGEPIHYIENYCSSEKSSDYSRNLTFTNNKWFVLRFAEEQIFKYQNECIQLIQQLVDNIDNLDCITNLKIDNKMLIKKWNKEEASRMAFHRYRFTYIPKYLQSLIVEETFEEYTKRKLKNNQGTFNINLKELLGDDYDNL